MVIIMSTVYIVFLIYRWLEIYLLYMRDSFIIILYFNTELGINMTDLHLITFLQQLVDLRRREGSALTMREER
jgi:hypothetical protein